MNVCPLCGIEYPAELESCPRDGARLGLSAVSTDPFIGRILADRYQILRALGEGGMGRVYLAEHVRMGRKSAVKVMSPALVTTPTRSAGSTAKRRTPAGSTTRTSRRSTTSARRADGMLYLAMEYVEGETLTAILAQTGRAAAARAADIFGADRRRRSPAAHDLGIVHRDLKPDNIIVATHARRRASW